MAIDTIEEALQDKGRVLSSAAVARLARDAYQNGNAFEVTVRVDPTKQGAAVTMRSVIESTRTDHGRLIRLK